jgi:hypothetical protein
VVRVGLDEHPARVDLIDRAVLARALEDVARRRRLVV